MDDLVKEYLTQVTEDLRRNRDPEYGPLEDQQRLVTYLRRYAPPAVSLRLVEKRELTKLIEPHKLNKVTVLFADIRNFVRFVATVEKHTSDLGVLRSMLGAFSNLVSEIIFKQEGMRDEFAGDRFMAIFGVPEPRPDDAIRALAAALELVERFTAINNDWQKLADYEIPPLQLGVGIHTGGPVVIADVGSRWRGELFAIGMTTNIASRLEQHTKEEAWFQTTGTALRIIVSETTYDDINAVADFSDPIDYHVRGMDEEDTIRIRHVVRADAKEFTSYLKHNIPDPVELREQRRRVDEIASFLEAQAERNWIIRISQALQQMGENLGQPEARDILLSVVERLPEMYHSDGASLLAVNGDQLVFAIVAGHPPEQAEMAQTPSNEGYVGRVVATQAPLIVFDMADDPPEKHYAAFEQRTITPRSLICAPVLARQQCLGAIQVVSVRPKAFTHEDLAILRVIAAQIALVLEQTQSSMFQ